MANSSTQLDAKRKKMFIANRMFAARFAVSIRSIRLTVRAAFAVAG
jgi:hypothetical protein